MITEFVKGQKLLVVDCNSPLDGQAATAYKLSKDPGVVRVKDIMGIIHSIPMMYLEPIEDLVQSNRTTEEILELKVTLFDSPRIKTTQPITRLSPDGVTGDTEADLFYTSELAGAMGARFVLYKEKHHTNKDVSKAKEYLRENFDVVSISTEKLEDYL